MPRALRHLSPVAVAALVSGLAGALVLLAVLDALVVRPLPGVASPERVFVHRGTGLSYPSVAGFVAAAEAPRSPLAAVGGIGHRWFAFSAGGGDRRIVGAAVAGDLFAVAGTRAAHGRLLGRHDDRLDAPSVAVIAEPLARDSFGSAAEAVGESIRLNGTPFTVVGVLPHEFRGFDRAERPLVWVAAHAWIAAAPTSYAQLSLDRWGWGWMDLVVRLAPGASGNEAAAQLQAEANRQRAEQPRFFRDSFEIRLLPATLAASQLPSPAAARIVSASLAALVALLLLLAVTSAAHLFLARGEARRAEIATRRALGADRRRIAALLLVEPLTSALVAIPIALVLARLALDTLAAHPLPGGIRLADFDLAIDRRVAIAGSLLAVLASVAAGCLPLVRSLRENVSGALLGRLLGAPSAARTRSLLVGTQVALSLLLLAATTLALRALGRAAEVDTGYDGERIGYVALDAGLTRVTPEAARELYRAALAAVAANPEVEAASLVSHLPLDTGVDRESLTVAGYEPAEGEPMYVEPAYVGPRALSTLGIALVAGREIDERDRAGGLPVAVVSQAAARRWFAGRDALGGRVELGGVGYTIVGVAHDVHAHGLDELQAPAAYFAYEQADDDSAGSRMALVFRGRNDAGRALAAARRAIAETAPGVPAEPSGTFDELYAAAVGPQRLGATLFGLFAGAGTLLAAVGLYGLVAFAAAARTREIGLRMALGARPGQILATVGAAALRPALAGAAFGGLLAIALAAAVRGLVFGLERFDPVAPLAAAAILLATAALASALPAWRASRLDAATALRES
jgi:predicted permease